MPMTMSRSGGKFWNPGGLLMGKKVLKRDDPIKATRVISCGAAAEGVDCSSAGAGAGAADLFVVEGYGYMVVVEKMSKKGSEAEKEIMK